MLGLVFTYHSKGYWKRTELCIWLYMNIIWFFLFGMIFVSAGFPHSPAIWIPFLINELWHAFIWSGEENNILNISVREQKFITIRNVFLLQLLNIVLMLCEGLLFFVLRWIRSNWLRMWQYQGMYVVDFFQLSVFACLCVCKHILIVYLTDYLKDDPHAIGRLINTQWSVSDWRDSDSFHIFIHKRS